MIDLKTLYEQTTMYCNLIKVKNDNNYVVEIFEQTDTPIQIVVYWSKNKIVSIYYTLKGE